MVQLLVLALLVTQSFAWWQLGHMVVAQVAQDRLEQLNATDALHSFTELIEAFKGLTDGKSDTFVQASVWADDIKSNRVKFFDNYHFTNMAYDPQHMFKAMTDYQRDVNSINIVGNCLTVLKTNKHGVTFERAFMARYLSHLVGDIHQPLHCTNMFNNTLKTGDLGGNLIHIKTKDGKSVNLHAFMDSMAGEQDDVERMVRPLNDSGKARIIGLASGIEKQFPAESFGNKTLSLDAHQWTVESFEAAVNSIYPFVLEHNVATQEWSNQIYTLCRERIALGGYRLANAILKIYS